MHWLLLIPAIIIADLAVMALLVWAILKLGWAPVMRSWPARTPAPDAVVRNYQSFRFGLMNFSLSIRAAADEEHLHLTPGRLLRWVGAGPISVPWKSITVKKRSRSGKWTTASFDGMTVLGPSWCLDLAEPAEATSGGPAEADPQGRIDGPPRGP